MAGLTFEEIAGRLGYNDRSAARKAAFSAIDQMVPIEEFVEWRRLQNARLERLSAALWPLALGDNGQAPDLAAVAEIRRLFERQARLLGLDQGAAHSVPMAPTEPALTIEEKRAVVSRVLERRREQLVAIGHPAVTGLPNYSGVKT